MSCVEFLMYYYQDNSISKLQEKHSLELKLQEVEIKQQALIASSEQLKAELEDTKSLLRVEQDQKTQRALEASNQEELYKRLQQEMKGIVEEKARLSGLLESADQFKTTLESRVHVYCLFFFDTFNYYFCLLCVRMYHIEVFSVYFFLLLLSRFLYVV